jgi:hypothetical protein
MTVALDKAPVWMVAELRRRTGLPLHECRRMLDAATLAEYKRLGGDYNQHFPCDQAEDDPAMATVLLRATLEVDAKLPGEDRTAMGFCHLLWGTKQRVLRDRYGIVWSRPDQLSNIVFD